MTEEQVIKGKLLLESIQKVKRAIEVWTNCENVNCIEIIYNYTYNSTTEYTDALTEINKEEFTFEVQNLILKYYNNKLKELQKEFDEL